MNKIKKVFLLIIFGFSTLFIIPNTLNAATTFKTTASTSKAILGKTFTVTVKISSSEKLGSWEYTIDYNSSVLSLVSGQKSVADFGNGSKTSASYTYTFKAIKPGSSNISVKSYGAISWGEVNLKPSATGTSVSVITQAQLEASYSKDNNLKSLSVDSVSLSPAFDSKITNYTAELPPSSTSVKINATANDKKASISGVGTFSVIEGENKFSITVTAENGSTKIYTVTVNVVDPKPIIVKTSNGAELTVVKRGSALIIPDGYISSTITINEQQIPALTSEISKLTLVGLKNSEGKIDLYIYENGEYTKYIEIKLNNLILFPIDNTNDKLTEYKKVTLTISEQKVKAYKYNENSNFAIIYAMDTESGIKNYYTYDLKNNTAILYNDEEIINLNKKINLYMYIIIGMLIETGILFIILILLLRKISIQNKRKNEKLKNEKSKIESNIEEKHKQEKIENKKKDKK